MSTMNTHPIKKIVGSPWIYCVIRIVLGGIFVYAGFIKLIDPKAFAKVISQYDIVPDVLLAPFAIGLPILELISGVGLILNVRGSLAITFSLLVLFVAVLGYGILNDLNIDCGCFTQEEIAGQNNLRQAFYRDLFMIGCIFLLFLKRPQRLFRNTHHSHIEINNLTKKEDV